MKEIIIKNILIIKILFFNLIKISFQNEICSSNINCENCDKCQIIENENNSCEYGNLFCRDNQNLIFFTDLKNFYINYFQQKPETTYICGEQNININGPKSIKILEIGNKDKNNLINRSHHCYYNINTSIDKDYDLFIKFSLYSQNSENNKLSFSLYFNFANSNNFIFTDNDLRNNRKYFQLNSINTFSIIADINKINNEKDIGENLLVDIKVELNNNFIHKTQIPPGTNEESSSSGKDYKIYYIISGCIAGIAIVVIVVIKNCMKRKLYVNRARDQNQMNDLNRPEIDIYIDQKKQIENKKKIELLFNTKFYPRKYSSNIIKENTICSICLEKFEDRKSLISLTSCYHIFHYECLKRWGEENLEQFKCPNCNFDFLKEDEPIIINVNINNFINNNLISDNNYLSITSNRNNNNIDTLRSNNNLNIIHNFG